MCRRSSGPVGIHEPRMRVKTIVAEPLVSIPR